MNIFSMFSTEDLNTKLTTEAVGFHRVINNDLENVRTDAHSSVKIEFYKVGNIGYTLSVVTSEDELLGNILLSNDQMVDLVIKAEMIQIEKE